jgi:pimeloyl-ACP methyl ester carboxylesterase
MTLEPVRIDGPAGVLAGWTAAAETAAGAAPGAARRTRPVLFLHPINMRGLIWADVVAHLPADRAYYLPDLRAHGDSDAQGEFGLDAWLADIEAFVDAVGPSGPFHVVGGSLGGSLAVCLAAARPEQVLSVTGIGSSLNFAGTELQGVLDMFDELGVQGAFRKVFPEITFGPGVAPETIEAGIALANPNDVDTVKRVWFATVTSDSTDRASDVACPSLVITGEYDATCTPALGLEMARALHTEQLLMPDIGHMPMLEKPDRVAELLERHFVAAEATADAR